MLRLFHNNEANIEANVLSSVRQDRLTKGLLIFSGASLALEACGLLNSTSRLAAISIAACMIGIMIGGDGEYDPEQQPKLRR